MKTPVRIKHHVESLLAACGLEPARALSRPWREPEFARLYAGVAGVTLMNARRCHVLYQLARQSAAVPGALAEVGVYRGGTARLLALAQPSRRLLLFDTFSGLPPVRDGVDLHHCGDFADTSLEAVRRFVNHPRAEFRCGLFPATAAGLEDLTFAFVHVDCDLHDSVRDCCEWFYPRLAPGGVLLFDDYWRRTCPGARRAVDTFFAGKPEVPILTTHGQALVFRLPR